MTATPFLAQPCVCEWTTVPGNGGGGLSPRASQVSQRRHPDSTKSAGGGVDDGVAPGGAGCGPVVDGDELVGVLRHLLPPLRLLWEKDGTARGSSKPRVGGIRALRPITRGPGLGMGDLPPAPSCSPATTWVAGGD